MLREMAAPLVVHGPATAWRLGVRQINCLDMLELFAFAMPARAAAPTPVGLAMALGLDASAGGGWAKWRTEADLLPAHAKDIIL